MIVEIFEHFHIKSIYLTREYSKLQKRYQETNAISRKID